MMRMLRIRSYIAHKGKYKCMRDPRSPNNVASVKTNTVTVGESGPIFGGRYGNLLQHCRGGGGRGEVCTEGLPVFLVRTQR